MQGTGADGQGLEWREALLAFARENPLEVSTEREIFVDNLLVCVHWIFEMIAVERPCAMGV